MSTRIRLIFLLALTCFYASPAFAQVDARLESRVSALERRANSLPLDLGGVGFLFGAFCALWAQNTGRNSWLWFFLGMLFSIITVIVLLIKNGEDRENKRFSGDFR
ncbi:MAG: hypothetical protein ABI273_04020 [Lacunisphaera sp.]